MKEDLPCAMEEDLPGVTAQDLPEAMVEDVPEAMADDLLAGLEGKLEGVKITEDKEEVMNAQIVKDYNMWKENKPYLDDLVITHTLEWPSLTVEWLPDGAEHPGQDQSVPKIVLGTHARSDFPNYLVIAEVHMPWKDSFSEHSAKSKKVYPCACVPYSFFFVADFLWGLVCAVSPSGLLDLLRSLLGFEYFKVFNNTGGFIPFAYAPFFLSLPICFYNIILSLI